MDEKMDSPEYDVDAIVDRVAGAVAKGTITKEEKGARRRFRRPGPAIQAGRHGGITRRL
ncbi:hypothetical protein TREPR_1405 [Treponema primitia ZAS-2]|uniref:Uncharacterized protein n=1 Tax=Treponema primitia (strain ATCC BAA-887 / DSM 12427 / ZAS-2) TaxID=545694 RepID=F5YQ84_TREPZ|nr:hypothetical protein [Treponema primitia]AEF84372.1 hypothetical protein TREPR_1405 [Treponema primitia ZAS-2]